MQLCARSAYVVFDMVLLNSDFKIGYNSTLPPPSISTFVLLQITENLCQTGLKLKEIVTFFYVTEKHKAKPGFGA